MAHALSVITDDRYAPYTEVLLKSLDRAYPRHPDTVILGIDLSEDWKTRLLRYGRTRFVALPETERLKGPLLKDDRVSSAEAVYAGSFFWKHGFPEYDRMAKLDADMLVLGSLDELWSNERFLMIRDAYAGPRLIFRVPNDPAVIALMQTDGLTPPTQLGNGGMYVLPRQLRTREEYERLVSLTRRYGPHVMWAEQSILNLWMAMHGITPVNDRTLNFQERFFWRYLLIDRTRIKILHMNSLPYGRARLFLLKAAYHLLPSLPGTILYLMIHLLITPWVKVWWKITKITRGFRPVE